MDNKFKVIYIDPPWTFVKFNKQRVIPSRAAEQPYLPLSLEDLKQLPIRELADPQGCILLCWSTGTFLPQSLELLDSWGFEYKTNFLTWVKTTRTGKYTFGSGYYTRGNPEPCLLATIGKPKVLDHSIPELLISERPALHSKKPDEVYSLIERMSAGPYLEVFARQTAPGWTAVGNEVDGIEIGQSLRLLEIMPEWRTVHTNTTTEIAPGSHLLPASAEFYYPEAA